MIVRSVDRQEWHIIGGRGAVEELEALEVDVDAPATPVAIGIKRPRSVSGPNIQNEKRARTSHTPTGNNNASCLAPTMNAVAQKVLSNLKGDPEISAGAGDVFLVEGWRDRWCHCTNVGIRI